MAKLSLKGRLEDIRFLKEEYGVGTRQALCYIKTREELSDLRDKLCEKLGIRGSSRPTVDNISNICKYVGVMVQRLINLEGVKREIDNPRNMSFIFSINPYGNAFSDYLASPEDYEEHNALHFDYEKFLTEFLKRFKGSTDLTEEFRQVFLDFVEGDHPYLKDKRGSRFTFSEFVSLDLNLIDDGIFFDGELDTFTYREHSKDEIDDFESWLKYGDSSNVPKMRLDGLTEEVKCLLHGQNSDTRSLYNRALIDRTLNRIEIERKIALSFLLNDEGRFDCQRNPKGAIEDAIQFNKERAKTYSKSTQALELEKAPDYVLRKNREIKDHATYLHRALRGNRKWLLNVLTN